MTGNAQIDFPEVSRPRVDLGPYRRRVEEADLIQYNGKVTQVIGLVAESAGPHARIGELCEIRARRSGPDHPATIAEVVGFTNCRLLLMPIGSLDGVRPGDEVVATGRTQHAPVGNALLGRIVDGFGRPMDGGPPPDCRSAYPIHARPPNPILRSRIQKPLPVGVRALDGCLTLGRGQRMGIFAGSGVGKSTLLGMIARNTAADINVIALIGERGREVRDFLEESLGTDGLARSVVVVATSDQPALVRIKAALTATAIAEYFRDQEADVMLMMDSVTRLAMAQREVGLAIGEPPATRGYTPSVFALLPQLLERAGAAASSAGTITALYTVLVEGDDMNEPIADAVRGILDGHVVLSRELAHRGHYPAIDILQSVSRVMPQVTTANHQEHAVALREIMANYRNAEDLINIGAYVDGSNPHIDRARAAIDSVTAFLRQSTDQISSFEETTQALERALGDRQAVA